MALSAYRSVLVVISCIPATAIRAQSLNYAIIDLGHLGNPHTTAGRQINDAGEVTGWSKYVPDSASTHAFRWRNGKISDLGVVSSCCSLGFGINNFGDVVGESTVVTSFVRMAAVWPTSGSPFTIGAFDDDQSQAYGINEMGQVVGYSDLPSGSDRAFLWEEGVMYDLGTLGGDLSSASAINNAGTVAGYATDAVGEVWAVTWQDGVIAPLPLLSSDPGSAAYGINEAGVVCGNSHDEQGFNRAVLWMNGSAILLQQNPEGSSSSAWGINDRNDAAGFITLDGERTACAWVNGQELVLRDHLPPKSKWTELDFAWDINNSGMISGEGEYPPYTGSFDSRGWVMVPVTPAFSLAQPVPGLAGRRNTLTASGVTPGKKVYFVYGLQGGGSVIPGCDLAETLAAIQIEKAKVIGSATANGQGIATLNTFVPDAARNAGEVLIQAVIPGDCVISNLVVERFE